MKTQSQALKINTIKASQKDGKGTKASKKPPSQRELESIGDDPNCTNVIKHRWKKRITPATKCSFSPYLLQKIKQIQGSQGKDDQPGGAEESGKLLLCVKEEDGWNVK